MIITVACCAHDRVSPCGTQRSRHPGETDESQQSEPLSLHLRGGLTGHQYQEVGGGGGGLVGGAGSTAVRVGGASTASGGHAKCNSSRGG